MHAVIKETSSVLEGNAVFDYIREVSGIRILGSWNDSHTYKEVLDLLDTAISQRMQIAA